VFFSHNAQIRVGNISSAAREPTVTNSEELVWVTDSESSPTQ
jgi:hypothetical protein